MDLRKILLVAILCLFAGDVLAQTKIVPQGDIEGATDKDVVGWNPSLSVNGSVNLVDNSNVVGQVEGTSALFGAGVSGGADYVRGPMMWRNQLSITEGFAKTPVVDDFVKTNDELALESMYNYFFVSKLGVFGRVKLTTTLFPARKVTADPATYTLLSAEPGGASRSVTSDDLEVASAFDPVSLNYSAGAFAQPLGRDELTVDVRAGVGGRHTFASGVFVQNDDSATPDIELQELATVHQAGIEVFAGLTGKAQKDRLKYSAGVSLLYPVINNDDFDRSAGKLLRLALEATATVAIFDWMGVVYKGSIVRDPQLFPDGEELTQIQNSILLTFQYTLIDRKKGLAELKKKAAEEQAKKAQEDAERRAKEAEDRAKQLELELEKAKAQPQTPPQGEPQEPSATDGQAPEL